MNKLRKGIPLKKRKTKKAPALPEPYRDNFFDFRRQMTAVIDELKRKAGQYGNH